MNKLRKEARRAIVVWWKRLGFSEDVSGGGIRRKEIENLALRLQAITDTERQEAFEAGRNGYYIGEGGADGYEFTYKTYADYLKSQEGQG